MSILLVILIIIVIYFLYRRRSKSYPIINYRATIISQNTPNNIPLNTSNILFIIHNDKFQLNNETLNHLNSIGVNNFMNEKNPNINTKYQIPNGMSLPGTMSVTIPARPNEHYLSIYTKIVQTNEIILLSNLNLKENNKWIDSINAPLYAPNYNQPIAYIQLVKE